MRNHEGRSWRVLGRGGAWVMGLAVLACAPGDANRGGDTAAVATSTGGVAATPSTTADTAQSTTATGTDTAAAGQTQTTADTAPQQTAPADTAAASTTASTTKRSSTASRARSTGAAAEPSASGDTAAATSSTDTAASTGTAAATTATAPSDTGATQTAAPTGAQQQGGDKMAVTQEVYNGWKTFNANCNRCHGDDAIAAAGGIAPDLRQSIEQGRVDHKVYQQVVINGRIEKGMPPWKDLLTEQQVEEIWQYLVARTKGGLPTGRPKRKEG